MNPKTTNTLLDYSLNTVPNPLQASPEHGNIIYGALSVVISNGGNAAVQLSQLQFTIPTGALAQDLTANAQPILWSTSPTNLWNVAMTSPGVFVLLPQSGNPISVTTAGMVIQFYNIPINQQVGTAAITVNETASDPSHPQQQVRTAQFNVAKFPYGFYFSNFTPQVPMVQDGGTVTLTWLGSDNATYRMLWGSSSADVTNVRLWTSPALTSDTTFLLRVTVVSQGETVTSDLTTTVIVANPDLKASTLQVTGVSNLHGATTVGSTLSAAGAVTFGSTLSAAGAVTAGGLTVNGAATVGGTSRVHGELSVGGPLSVGGVTNLPAAVIHAGLTVSGGATVNGGLTATGSAVSLMSAATTVVAGQYAAKTDGFCVGMISQPVGRLDILCVGRIFANNSDGIQALATGGTIWCYDSEGKRQYAGGNINSMCLPVRKGTTWSCGYGPTFSGNQATPQFSFYWIPLGTAAGATFERIGEAVTPDWLAPATTVEPVPQSTDRKANELVEVLGLWAGRPVSQEIRERLLTVLRQIGAHI